MLLRSLHLLRSLFLRERNSARRRNAGPRRYLIGVGQTTKGASKKDKKIQQDTYVLHVFRLSQQLGRQCQTFHTGEVREKLLTRPSTLPSDDLSRLDFLPFFVCGRRGGGGGGGNSINLFTPKRTVLALPPNSLANRPIPSSAPVPRFS